MSRTTRTTDAPWPRNALNGSTRPRRARGYAKLRPYGQTWFGATCRCCTPAAGKWWKSAERQRARQEIAAEPHYPTWCSFDTCDVFELCEGCVRQYNGFLRRKSEQRARQEIRSEVGCS